MITDVDGVKHIEFGNGTVIVGAANWVEEGRIAGGALVFNSADKQPFGTPHPECCGKDAEEQGADTLIIFKSIETVDLVISYLKEVRKIASKIGEEQTLREAP